MSNWLWPLPGYSRLSSGVGPRWGRQHKGIDIPAPEGTPIIASREGEVTRAEYSSSYGNVVYIDHKDGYTSRYAHMVSLPMVSKGQRVSAGQQIGRVGNTGHSFGNHLHFEIRYGDVVQDPESYVDPSNTVQAPLYNSSVPGYTANNYTNPITGDYIGGVIPVMSSQFIEGKPSYAYLRIVVGDRELVYQGGKPNIIQSFEINRLEEAGCTAQFTIFDDNWNDLEPYLANNYNDIKIQYGYVGGPMSPEYKMLLQEYNISFTNTGTIMSIRAISEAIYQNLNPIELDTGTNNPSEAIKRICEHMGWKIALSDFVDTKPVVGRSNYVLSGVSPIQYIYEVILPDARTNDDLDETIVFQIDSVEGNVAHLKAKTYGESSEVDRNSVPTYIYMKGYDSVIESLSITTKGVFGGTTQFHTVTGLVANTIDDEDKTERTVKVDLDSSSSKSTGVGDRSATLANQSVVTYRSAGESVDQTEARLNYLIKNGASQAYEATMTILGDPNIRILQEVRLIILTDKGTEYHHTSGIYIVTGISDSIENGSFRTNLILRRNGDTEGIVLRSHKYKRV